MTAVRRLRAVVVDLLHGGVSKRFALLAVLLGFVLMAGVAFVVEIWPGLHVDGLGLSPDVQLQRENDLRTTGLQALAGVVLALGAAFTAYSILSNREGQLDERFSRALGLLAGNAHDVRGGAHSLERIAVQSVFDRAAVVEVLAGFIRDRTHAAPDREGREKKLPPPEIVEALTVLGRVKQLPKSPVPHLQGTGWFKAELEGVNLSGVRLPDSNFEEANLTYADLRNASLVDAKLSGARLRGANLRGADLSRAFLEDADLRGADLSGADLTAAVLMGANVNGKTKLSRANFTEAVLLGLKIDGADLSRADIAKARLEEAEYTKETKFPAGFDPVEHKMLLVVGER
jgi:hypothetical protein